ncbi:hypothetical protein Br6_01373 [Rhodococcus sp. Br-6]|jgi:hypothetical protein|nr:hypothetical protein H849_06833 [Prescottella equi NBRC 101255 = C 7]GBF14010.1 hypothetical protein Br6_01373 [Rhodococcus sp. Br-6]SUE05842.1 Uncharacterised protein [Prescottella equi]SUE17738.1 Uncharacterised protein [Prescottella equi]
MSSLADLIKIPVMSVDALGVGLLNSFRNLIDYAGLVLS